MQKGGRKKGEKGGGRRGRKEEEEGEDVCEFALYLIVYINRFLLLFSLLLLLLLLFSLSLSLVPITLTFPVLLSFPSPRAITPHANGYERGDANCIDPVGCRKEFGSFEVRKTVLEERSGCPNPSRTFVVDSTSKTYSRCGRR